MVSPYPHDPTIVGEVTMFDAKPSPCPQDANVEDEECKNAAQRLQRLHLGMGQLEKTAVRLGEI